MTMPTIEDLMVKHYGLATLVHKGGHDVYPDEARRLAMRAVLDALQPVVAEALERAHRDGLARVGLDPNLTAELLIAQLKGERRE